MSRYQLQDISSGAAVDFPGGHVQIMAQATAWAGASVIVQMQTPTGDWIALDPTILTFTANAIQRSIASRGPIRIAVTGAPTGLQVWAVGIPIT